MRTHFGEIGAMDEDQALLGRRSRGSNEPSYSAQRAVLHSLLEKAGCSWLLETFLIFNVVFALTGCRVHRQSVNHAREQDLYASMLADPRTFNPIIITDAASGGVINDVFESFVRMNPMTTLPEPGLAQSWEVSPDNRTITFHLRHDVRWFDGRPFTAGDVVFTMKVIYDPKIPNSFRPILTVDGKQIVTTAPDDYTVVMKLPKPFAPLFYALGVQIVPEHILKARYEAGEYTRAWGINANPRTIVGNGAFKLVRYVPAQVAQEARNDDYWMKDEHGRRLPRLHRQTILIVQDQNAQYLRFLSGQTDVYSPRPEEVSDLILDSKKLGITVQEMGIDTGSLFFSFNRNPKHFVKKGVTDPRLNWFTDLNFLRAMAHSIDKNGIIDLAFHGLAVPAIADISPENKLFHNPNLKDYDFDLAEAARLLEAGGYHLVSPGVRVDSKGNRLEFNLTTNTGASVREQVCAIFKQDLESLGIKVNYRPLEFTTLVDKLDSTFDWDCILIGFTGGVEPNDGANLYRSSGNLHLWNPNQTKPATEWEAEIDRLLDQGASEMDLTKRPPYYWRIQEILHDQLPMIQTVRQRDYLAWRNTLENYHRTVWGLYKPEWIQFKE